jgi:HK97 family phage portal protein
MSIFTRFMRRITKSLFDLHPELVGRVPMFSMTSDGSDAGQATANHAESYTNYMWLQKAINILANNISPLSLRVVKGSGNDSKFLDSHKLYDLLYNPNDAQGPADFWREWLINLMISGEYGIECVGNKGGNKIVEMWGRTADTITVQVAGKRYRNITGYKIDDKNGEPYSIDPFHFIHSKFYNPLSPFRGLSPVTAIRYSIAIDQFAQAWTMLFFKNQARPDYAVIAKEGLTPSEKTEIEKKLANRFSGEGVHQPIVLEEGVTDIKIFSYPPKDMEWVNQREFSRDEVAAIIGVPDEIMGYGKDTYENFAQAERVLWNLTISPLCGMRDSLLTRFFRKIDMLGADEDIETDLREIPALQEDKTGKITQWSILTGRGVPINAASDYLGLNLPKVEGGDVGYLPSGYIPLTADRTGSVLGLGIESPISKDILSPEDDANPKVFGSTAHKTLYKAKQQRLDTFVKDVQRIAKREIQRQQNEVGQKLRDGKSFGRGIYKDETVPQPSELFDLAAEIKKWKEALRKAIAAILAAIGAAEYAEVGGAGRFDISRPECVKAVETILTAVSTKTNETTWSDLIALFQEAETNGEGIPAIQERLSEYFGDRKSDYQTERIARTTTTGTSNSGSLEAWRQSEVVSGKSWLSALTDRTRDAHAEAHGQEVGIDEPFIVGGESLDYPGDPSGSPGNIINCLCSTLAVLKE